MSTEEQDGARSARDAAEATGRGRVRRVVMPAVAATTVLAVVGATAYALASRPQDRGASGPPKLRLVSGTQASAASRLMAGDQAGGGSSAGSGTGSGTGTVRLEGTLPAGPSAARVFALRQSTVDAATVRALAAALGIHAQPRHTSDGWAVGDSTAQLYVSDDRGQSWNFTRTVSRPCAVPLPLPGPKPPGTPRLKSLPERTLAPPASGRKPLRGAADDPAGTAAKTATATASPRVDPDSPVDCLHTATVAQPPTADAARHAARPVLDAVGLSAETAEARVRAGYSSTSVVVNPRVDAKPTANWTTAVWVGAHGVESASGWLSRPQPGATYPLITAAQAFEQLRRTPWAAPAIACLRMTPDSTTGGVAKGGGQVPGRADRCPDIRPPVVTGATFGYSLQWETGQPLLVPSWLFRLAGMDAPTPEVAVDPRYLGGG